MVGWVHTALPITCTDSGRVQRPKGPTRSSSGGGGRSEIVELAVELASFELTVSVL